MASFPETQPEEHPSARPGTAPASSEDGGQVTRPSSTPLVDQGDAFEGGSLPVHPRFVLRRLPGDPLAAWASEPAASPITGHLAEIVVEAPASSGRETDQILPAEHLTEPGGSEPAVQDQTQAADAPASSTALMVLASRPAEDEAAPSAADVYKLLSEQESEFLEALGAPFEALQQAIHSTVARDYLLEQLTMQYPGRTFPDTWIDSLLPQVEVPPDYLVHRAINEANATRAREHKTRIPDQFFETARAYLCGWGPLERLRLLPGLTEVVINERAIIIEQHGTMRRLGHGMNRDAIYTLAEKLGGRRPTPKQPFIDFEAPDGSRGHVNYHTVGLPDLTLRHHADHWLTAEELVGNGTLTSELLTFFRAAMQAHLNIAIAGPTTAGKTTLLQALLGLAAPDERWAIIEERPELPFQRDNLVRLWPFQSTSGDSADAMTLADLVKQALRKRPDRVIVGEIRGKEIAAMLQAMNTGHHGSLTTVHANSAQETLIRLATLALEANPAYSRELVGLQIASALHLVINVTHRHGQRRVSDVLQIGVGRERDQSWTITPLFQTTREQGQDICRPTYVLPDQRLVQLFEFYRVPVDILRNPHERK